MQNPQPATTAAPSILRLPPQAQEAEQSVLGGLLLDSRRWDEITETVNAEDFYARPTARYLARSKRCTKQGKRSMW